VADLWRGPDWVIGVDVGDRVRGADARDVRDARLVAGADGDDHDGRVANAVVGSDGEDLLACD
jgi:hypothetical protein